MVLLTTPAMAYIGPGAGISFLGSFLSALIVILLAIAAILFWPLRYLWRRLRRPQPAQQQPLKSPAGVSTTAPETDQGGT